MHLDHGKHEHLPLPAGQGTSWKARARRCCMTSASRKRTWACKPGAFQTQYQGMNYEVFFTKLATDGATLAAGGVRSEPQAITIADFKEALRVVDGQ